VRLLGGLLYLAGFLVMVGNCLRTMAGAAARAPALPAAVPAAAE
jgi:cbb3-type cytochrome oxidase subunit 1